MLFTELAVQNVRGFSPAARVAFKTGYWVLLAPEPAVAPLTGLVCETCYPDGRGQDAAFLAPGAKAGKAGLLLQGSDSVLYRLMRELGGAGALHRLAPGASAYEAVSTQPDEITGFLKTHLGLLDRRLFEGLFCFRQNQLPSKAPPPKSAGKGLAQQSQWAGLMDATSTSADPAAKVAALEAEQRLAQEVEQLQYRLDGVLSSIFQEEQVLKSTETLEARIAEARKVFADAPTPEKLQLPADIIARAERLPLAEAKLKEGLAKLEAEGLAPERSSTTTYVEPLYRDWRFDAAAGLGVLVVAVGAVASGALKYIALLDVPSFGFAAVLALKYVDDVQASRKVTAKGGRMADREKKLRDTYALDAGPVDQAIKALGVENATEVIAALNQRTELGNRVHELEAELVEARAAPRFLEATAKLPQLRAEQQELNAELEAKGTYVRDLREIERELAKARGAAGAGPAAPTSGLVARVDPVPALLRLSVDLFASDAGAVTALLKDRAAQYFSALTDRRWMGIDISREGQGTAVGPSGKCALSALPARDLDFAYLALRFTLLEKFSARSRVPIVLDGFLDEMEESKHALLAKMLKHLGTLTQVLQLSGRPAFASAAEGSLKV